MQRVLHYRVHGLQDHRLERLHEQFDALAAARTWRCEKPWISSSYSRGLFEMEYFRHTVAECEPETAPVAAGFVKMAPTRPTR